MGNSWELWAVVGIIDSSENYRQYLGIMGISWGLWAKLGIMGSSENSRQ